MNKPAKEGFAPDLEIFFSRTFYSSETSGKLSHRTLLPKSTGKFIDGC